MNTYTEVSPSGTGLRFFAKGQKPGADWNFCDICRGSGKLYGDTPGVEVRCGKCRGQRRGFGLCTISPKPALGSAEVTARMAQNCGSEP